MWTVRFQDTPVFTVPSLADIAQYLGLGDIYDSTELDAIRIAASQQATIESGRAIGKLRFIYTLRILDRTFFAGQYLLLPYAGVLMGMSSLWVDGVLLNNSQCWGTNYGIYAAVKFVKDVRGSEFIVDYSVGSTTLSDTDKALLLMTIADLYRCRESTSPVGASSAAITARALADQERVFFVPRIADELGPRPLE